MRLAVPAVLAQLINLLYNLVDRMYVGNIAGVGTQALAGLGVVFPVTLIVSAFANLVGMGGAPLASIFLGEQKPEDANKVFNAGVGMLCVFSVLLTAAVLVFCDPLVRLFGAPKDAFLYARSYLFVYGCGSLFVMVSLGLNPFITAQGFSVTSMLTVAIGAVLNIALDPIFIFVLNMGVEGAALATILSQGVSAAWVASFFFRKKSLFRFSLRKMLPSLRTVLKIAALGLSPFIMSVTESAIQIVFNVNLTKWSGDNSDYTAALTIMLSAVQIISLPLNGLGTGIQPLISYNYGTGNSARIRAAVKRVALVALCCSGTVWAVSLLAPQVYGYLFNASAPVMELLKKYTPFFMAGTVCFFRADDAAKRVRRAQPGEDLYLSCLPEKGDPAHSALLCAPVRVRRCGHLLQRGDRGRRRRHCHGKHLFRDAAAHSEKEGTPVGTESIKKCVCRRTGA